MLTTNTQINSPSLQRTSLKSSKVPLFQQKEPRLVPAMAKDLPMPSSSQLRALLAPQIRFSGHKLTDRDYTVTPDPDYDLNAYMASKTLRALQMRDLYKKHENDPSHLKLNLNLSSGSPNRGESALADNLLLLEKPTDVLIDSQAGPASIPALMMTRLFSGMLREATGGAMSGGKRFMGRYANVRLGPVGMYLGGENRAVQIRRELVNEDFQMRVGLVMLATGEKNRDKVASDLSGNENFNALQALAYGENGIVDAILIGEDKVLTREGLNSFYKMKNFTPEQIEEFNQDALNVDEIADNPAFQNLLIPLADFSPGSVVPDSVLQSGDRPRPYFTFREKPKAEAPKGESKAEVKEEKQDQKDASEGEQKAEAQADTRKPAKLPELRVGMRGMDDPDFKIQHRSRYLNLMPSATADKPSQVEIDGARPSQGLIYDDMIVYNDAFDMDTAAQITESLQALKQKKLEQKDPSNIKLLLNSPGGDVRAAYKISNELDSGGKIKTDVIVDGMAASCGAWLLANATGNKLATPQARIMIHQPSISAIRGANPTLGNQSADYMDSLYRHIAGVISRATGRDRVEVETDLNQDTWLNPLEAMFYGSLKDNKGLLDGILVGPNQAIVREDVLDYLKTDPKAQEYITHKFGPSTKSGANVEKYLEARLQMLRTPKRQWKKQDEQDPFNDPVRTIMQIATHSAKDLDKIERLKGSATRPWDKTETRTIDHFIVGRGQYLPSNYWNQDEPEIAPERVNPRKRNASHLDEVV